jgi:hypothetical protein
VVSVNGEVVGRTPARPRTQAPQWQASVQLRGLRAAGPNVVRVEIMNKNLLADETEGAVEFRGEGLAMFEGCLGRLGRYPVLQRDGSASGELLCQLQARPVLHRMLCLSN